MSLQVTEGRSNKTIINTHDLEEQKGWTLGDTIEFLFNQATSKLSSSDELIDSDLDYKLTDHLNNKILLNKLEQSFFQKFRDFNNCSSQPIVLQLKAYMSSRCPQLDVDSKARFNEIVNAFYYLALKDNNEEYKELLVELIQFDWPKLTSQVTLKNYRVYQLIKQYKLDFPDEIISEWVIEGYKRDLVLEEDIWKVICRYPKKCLHFERCLNVFLKYACDANTHAWEEPLNEVLSSEPMQNSLQIHLEKHPKAWANRWHIIKKINDHYHSVISKAKQDSGKTLTILRYVSSLSEINKDQSQSHKIEYKEFLKKMTPLIFDNSPKEFYPEWYRTLSDFGLSSSCSRWEKVWLLIFETFF